MSTASDVHAEHTHQHGDACGHVAVAHGEHTDYLHDGHAHSWRDGGWQECDVRSHTEAEGHEDHEHGAGCGHEAVAHDEHVDYVHGEHRHAAHEGHWDEH